MPLDIEKLQQRRVPVEITYFGETFNVYYDPVKVGGRPFRREYTQVSRDYAHKRRDWLKDITERVKAAKEEHADDPDALAAALPREYDDNDLSIGEMTWDEHAALAAMLIEDWDIVNDGKRLPVDAVYFTDGTLTPELAAAITRAVFDDVHQLGNRNASANSS